MRLAVFFMSLCFLLSRGNTYISMAVQGGNYTHHTQKPQKAKFTNSDYSLFTDTDWDSEEEHVVSDDDVNDNLSDDSFLAQQFKMMAMCYASVPYHSILNYYHNCYRNPPSFLGQASHKYILQGVLRI
ncbi:hypothetical protein F0919_16455 [Taibaiella lutea]|uniref:Uncharacterized protein n=1 Tax=Taibaiella lutea TaxID=2608001 RepID=A0A5M6CEQ6_9BACT|nr:hypothetical protein [Taibaiella lutea]KAA5532382.1 hypothetical protein F0919_16455 [Taibaiella lutea]